MIKKITEADKTTDETAIFTGEYFYLFLLLSEDLGDYLD